MSILAGVYDKTPLNQIEIPQAELNIIKKQRSNPLPWNGQFSPQLVQVLLKKYAKPNAVLFDPFLGSGTVLLEAGLMGLSASGVEINPAAISLARLYQFINLPVSERRTHLVNISNLLQTEFAIPLPLFQPSSQIPPPEDIEILKYKLINLHLTISNSYQSFLLQALITLLDFYKADLSIKKIFSIWQKLTQLIIQLPFSTQSITVLHNDARQVPQVKDSVDLVITSPPYINVFNYHQKYRASMEALNWDLLNVAKSEIGSNRKNRGNRFLTIIQFCLDISQTLAELQRLCRSDSRIIFVVGRESTVRGIPFFNGELVTEIANRVLGFKLILKQERVFKNRFGQHIFEDILHFSPSTVVPTKSIYLSQARNVAKQTLEVTYLTASETTKVDIKSALAKINQVSPSPLFNPDNAYKKVSNRKFQKA